jgi:hypothetical protein
MKLKDKCLNLKTLKKDKGTFDKVMKKFKRLGLKFYGNDYNFEDIYKYPIVSFDERTGCLRACQYAFSEEISIKEFLED